VDPADLAEAVAEVTRGLGRSRRVVVAGDLGPYEPAVDEGLAAAHADVLRPEAEAWVEGAAGADLGITSARLAVAATGSILLVPGPHHPRVASLLPGVHLAVVPTSRLVPGLEEVMEVLGSVAGSSSAPVLVTGPSRTTDIEMTTVLGVHGPRAVHVLLVNDPE
jgi:L-lactate dehydrogenase complex protein LldG